VDRCYRCHGGGHDEALQGPDGLPVFPCRYCQGSGEAILGFQGDYRWLSNFWPAAVVLPGDSQGYPTVEHAFQAAKTGDPGARRQIRGAAHPGRAKALGRALGRRRPDWEVVRVGIMRELLRQKFGVEPLRSRLLATGSAYLEEGNTWGDTFWGRCNGVGRNELGQLLMSIRAELREHS
jgi:ribA/ribD-fused uncharacterized protein